MIRVPSLFRSTPLRAVKLALAGGVMLGLSGCAMNSEEEVRALIADWAQLQYTIYFKSRMGCTAALIAVETPRLSAVIARARSVEAGMQAMAKGAPVAFDVAGVSPTEVSEQIMTADLPKGLGVLSSGVAGKDCMDDATRTDYLRALLDPTSIMVFEPTEKFMVVLDKTNSRLFFSRGSV